MYHRRHHGLALVCAISLTAALFVVATPSMVLGVRANSFTFADIIVDTPWEFTAHGSNDVLEPTFSYPDPDHGSIQIDGPLVCVFIPIGALYGCDQPITYLPDPGFVGTDVWQYTVHDPLNGVDAFGVVSLSYVDDVTAPVGALDPHSADPNSASGWTNGSALSVGVTATDDISGVANVRLSNHVAGGTLVRSELFAYPVDTPSERLAWSLQRGRVVVGTRGSPSRLRPGTYVMYAQWGDAVGNWSDVTSASIKLDPFPPTLAGIGLGAGWNWFAPGIPLHVEFPAADTGGSGVELYELQKSVNGGAFVDAASDASGGFVDLMVSPTNTYRFRARARDLAGSWTNWVSTAAFKAVEVDEGSASIVYAGRWRDVGSSKMTTAAGATAKLTFTGTTVAWSAVRGPSKGRASVYIDGVFVKTIDLHKSTVENSYEAYRRTWATAGKHTILVKALGTSGRPEVHIDWFLVVK